jgi:hypothetical protein
MVRAGWGRPHPRRLTHPAARFWARDDGLVEVPDADSGVVALASYPRSGNSLLRLLLERATGVWTGSIYKVRVL